MNIGYDGKVKVFFSQKMVLIKEFHILNDVTVDVRHLETKPVIEVEVIPAPDQDKDKLGLFWNVTDYSDQYIEFQLNFTDALAVSS